MKKAIFIILVALTYNTYSQDLNKIYKKSITAYEGKDFQEFKNLNIEALKTHPSQPTFLYNLAASYSLTGDYVRAKNTLEKLLSWDSSLKFENDNDFNLFIKNSKHLAELKAAIKLFKSEKISSNHYFEIDKKHHVEDLLKIDDKVYLTDIRSGKIIVYSLKNKRTNTLIGLSNSAIAIVKGGSKKTLWVSTGFLPQFKAPMQESLRTKESLLFEINLQSEKIISKIELPENSIIGSMVLGEDGLLYATNSSSPEIIVIDTKKKEIVKIHKISDAKNLQGITLNEKNNDLYVADYIMGILKINTKNMKDGHIWINSEKFLLKGIDGLSFINDNTLVAIQNNSNPKRLIKLKHDNKVIKKISLLDNGLGVSGEPTNGKYYPGLGYIYITNSQWPHYDKTEKPISNKWENQKIRLVKL